MKRFSCSTFMSLVVVLYSTILSGIWLAIAIRRPAWGSLISAQGTFTQSTASTTCTLLAKSIELSFVCAFVAYLGQTISRRACAQRLRGVNTAELFMRSWVLQPGSIVAHFDIVRRTALTWLGGLTLTVTLLGMLYTSASDTLGESCRS